MKDSMLERLKDVISTKSSSILDFSNKIGVPQTTLNNQIKSPRGISVSVILLTLNTFPDISAEWLLRGKGEMILSDNLPPILGDESENDLDTHAKLAQATKEIDILHQEIAVLKEKNLKQAGCIEWQKDFISELISEKTELEKKLPNEAKKDIV
jgi:hypothetical protein